MTSNMAAQFVAGARPNLGFGESSQKTVNAGAAVVKEVERELSPELINRIDEVVVFNALTPDDMVAITQMHVGAIVDRVASDGKSLEIEPAAMSLLASEGYSRKYGARHLKRHVDRVLKLPLTAKWNEGTKFRAKKKKDGGITVEVVAG